MNFYHECGYPLLVESLSYGDKFLTEYYDPNVKDHAEKVRCCPKCGQHLGRGVPIQEDVIFTYNDRQVSLFPC